MPAHRRVLRNAARRRVGWIVALGLAAVLLAVVGVTVYRGNRPHTVAQFRAAVASGPGPSAAAVPAGSVSPPPTFLSSVRAAPGGRGARLRAVDGGGGYFAKFSNPLPGDPSFFPIGVWFESVLSSSDSSLDKAAGINTYVQLTENSDLG